MVVRYGLVKFFQVQDKSKTAILFYSNKYRRDNLPRFMGTCSMTSFPSSLSISVLIANVSVSLNFGFGLTLIWFGCVSRGIVMPRTESSIILSEVRFLHAGIIRAVLPALKSKHFCSKYLVKVEISSALKLTFSLSSCIF